MIRSVLEFDEKDRHGSDNSHVGIAGVRSGNGVRIVIKLIRHIRKCIAIGLVHSFGSGKKLCNSFAGQRDFMITIEEPFVIVGEARTMIGIFDDYVYGTVFGVLCIDSHAGIIAGDNCISGESDTTGFSGIPAIEMVTCRRLGICRENKPIIGIERLSDSSLGTNVGVKSDGYLNPLPMCIQSGNMSINYRSG